MAAPVSPSSATAQPAKSATPAPLSIFPPSPVETKPLAPLPGNSEKFKAIVRQVQMALIAFGYAPGPVTGEINPATRDAIQRAQGDFKIGVTGTITPQLLDALRIVAK
jgi:His-Xaa-Ser repeat protein HxsA